MALDQHGTLLKMVVMVSQHHFTGRPCWSWLSWFICLSSRLWAGAPLATAGPARHGQAVPETGRRLQARLGQATPAGPGPTVRAGPPLLTHASSGTARAGRRVTEPPGHNTPGGAKGRGPDPVRPEVARPQRRTRGETARPRRRVAIPTPHGQHRPL